MTNASHLSHLLILASSNLPIGSYTYSQGMESAIDTGSITNEATALAFLQDYQNDILLGSDLILLASLMVLLEKNPSLADPLCEFYQASRDSFEFALESQQLAQAFTAWISEVLQMDMPSDWAAQGYLPLFARLCQYWQLPVLLAMQTYGFAQMENLTLAVVKTLPLGQMAGQRIIWQLQTELASQLSPIEKQVSKKLSFLCQTNSSFTISALISLLNISSTQPTLSHLSCVHEQQYSRLFRS